MPRCFKKRVSAPPQWYVMRPSTYSSESGSREGPYSRAGIAQMVKEQTLADTDMVWTNERIFPNTKRSRNVIKILVKKKLVRQTAWKRFDQLPDPVRKLIEAEAHKVPDRRAQVKPGEEAYPPPVPRMASHQEGHNPTPPTGQHSDASPPGGHPPAGYPPSSGPH